MGRSIGLDVHRDFCEVAIADNGRARSAGRVTTSEHELKLFAASLAADDRVVLEVTGNALAIARIIEPHVDEVLLANARRLKAISSARVKTDKVDARMLADLLAADLIPPVWAADERTRKLRRLVSRRRGIVKRRTQIKNEVAAVLQHNLKGKPPAGDPFGRKGRSWMAAQELPADERLTIDASLRQLDFLGGELKAVEQLLAQEAADDAEARLLMTIPGFGMVTAITMVAAIGDVARFPNSRKLVGYLGLHPRVRQSGSSPARHGRLSKEGPSAARHVLIEAAWAAVRQPGPLRAFGRRVAARRGPQVAAVAVARKLAVLVWCLLSRGEDYAYGRPSLTRRKVRKLELLAGGEPRKRGPRADPIWKRADDAAERELAERAERAYERTVADRRSAGVGVRA